MTFPAARVSDLTVTGDMVLPPGVPQVLIGGLPAAVVSNQVYGPVINASPGMISNGATTVLIGGRPAARVTSVVSGGTTATPVGPVPVATTIGVGCMTVLIGG